jgi:Multiubiquitin
MEVTKICLGTQNSIHKEDGVMSTGISRETDDRHLHEHAIIVDGQKKEVPSNLVSYAEVVDLAYPGQSGDVQYTLTVTYRHAAEEPHDGTLVPDKTVRVKRGGTVFNVTRTTRA